LSIARDFAVTVQENFARQSEPLEAARRAFLTAWWEVCAGLDRAEASSEVTAVQHAMIQLYCLRVAEAREGQGRLPL
jgi:hypothetical protein